MNLQGQCKQQCLVFLWHSCEIKSGSGLGKRLVCKLLSHYFLVTGVPAAPLNVAVNQVERVSGGGSVTITVSWIQPPNYELFDIDRYDINVSSTSGIQQMTITVSGGSNSTVFTVTENPSNVRPSTTFTISISARNKCGENGPIVTASYTLSKFWYMYISSI